MPDRRTAAEVRAAGAVLWRPAGRGAQVAIIHRPKYDDWGFAKGKLDPGEHVLLAADSRGPGGDRAGGDARPPAAAGLVRQRRSTQASRLLAGAAAGYGGAGAPGFTANSEVDRAGLAGGQQAAARLSYARDSETLGRVQGRARGGPRPLILVRHASAGSKSDWRKDDASRPLDSRGKKEAKSLAGLLRCFGYWPGADRASRPVHGDGAPVRCRDRRLAVEVEPAFELAAKAE